LRWLFSVLGDGRFAYPMLFSVPRDGNHGLEIGKRYFPSEKNGNKELCWLFSVHGDGHLAYSMLFSVPRDGNHGVENAIFRKIRSCVRYFPSLGRTVSIFYAIF